MPWALRLSSASALILSGLACNAISGVDDYAFDLGRGGRGGVMVNPTGRGGSGGMGGSGGTGGVPCDLPCNDPPSDCVEVTGSCVDGSCIYAPLSEGTSCEDGDPCTHDLCNAEGQCVPGPECPNDDPCLDVTCDEDAAGCVSTLRADGTSCGAEAADRCCGGVCVDISSDSAHCGGCGYTCEGGQACESIADTNQCANASSNTSGRCTCSANAQCPASQICRTVSPHAGRCTPNGGANCPANDFVDQQLCPNFCSY